MLYVFSEGKRENYYFLKEMYLQNSSIQQWVLCKYINKSVDFNVKINEPGRQKTTSIAMGNYKHNCKHGQLQSFPNILQRETLSSKQDFL